MQPHDIITAKRSATDPPAVWKDYVSTGTLPLPTSKGAPSGEWPRTAR